MRRAKKKPPARKARRNRAAPPVVVDHVEHVKKHRSHYDRGRTIYPDDVAMLILFGVVVWLIARRSGLLT